MMADDKKRLFAWGSSKSHQLTVDSSLIIPYPILCEFDEEVDRVYAKSDYNIVTVGNSIYSWGSDTFGRLGMPIASKIQKTPKKIHLENVSEVGIGEYHAAACL
jgi:alpha-tubulin suppressor-like RCC1 family protein